MKVQLVAVGGTALTLMNTKASTRHVDFTGPGPDIVAFRKAAKRLQAGFKVDTWKDGQVFMVSLPEDYLKRSTLVRRMKHMELRHAHPVDLVVTKLGRYDDRDQQDIEATIRAFKLRKADVQDRCALVGYAGNQDVLEANLDHLIRHWPRKRR